MKKLKINKIIIAVLLSAFFANFHIAHSQVSPVVDKKDSVKRNMLLSVGIGPSYNLDVNGTGDLPVQTEKFGGSIDGKIGFPIKSNLYIHVEAAARFSDFKYKRPIKGYEGTPSIGINVKQIFYGLGATYFVNFFNSFLAGSVGISSYRYESSSPDQFVIDGTGLGARVKIGKNWMIAQKMALGLNLGYDLSFINAASTYDIIMGTAEKVIVQNVNVTISFSYY